ncbi:hypothetical protein HLV35_02485 [Eggerthellaceae bacterium zg-997]|nr:hypothetical protein [Eggerthellaceae bacterium zg-997]
MAGSANTVRSPYYGDLQHVIDQLFCDPSIATVRRLDVILAVEANDLPADLVELAGLLPPGTYTRRRLCDQLNSAIAGHAWGQVYGTVQ